jgi:hypothetical protein
MRRERPGFCIDERTPSPGRSRSASLVLAVKGRAWRHRLLRAPGMCRRFSLPTEPQALPGMLDEPDGSLPHSDGLISFVSPSHLLRAWGQEDESLSDDVGHF